MQAIILAAGKSQRFAPFTYEKPKGLFRVRGEILINRQIEQLFTGTSPYSYKERYKKSWFSSTVMVEFEGRLMPAPVGYHELLTHIYGDYMQLPPEDKRGEHS